MLGRADSTLDETSSHLTSRRDLYDVFTFGPVRVRAFATARRSPPSTVHRSPLPNQPPGSGLVELALVVPVLLFLLVGALDLGRVFYSQIAVTDAAKEGALVASQGRFKDRSCRRRGGQGWLRRGPGRRCDVDYLPLQP